MLLSFNRSLDLSILYQNFFHFQEDYIDGVIDFQDQISKIKRDSLKEVRGFNLY